MCVPAGRGSKWHKRRTVATIATNRQVYLREEAHAFPQRVNPGYTGVIGHHAKRVPLQIEPATFMSRPTRDTGGYEPLLKAPLAKITVRTPSCSPAPDPTAARQSACREPGSAHPLSHYSLTTKSRAGYRQRIMKRAVVIAHAATASPCARLLRSNPQYPAGCIGRTMCHCLWTCGWRLCRYLSNHEGRRRCRQPQDPCHPVSSFVPRAFPYPAHTAAAHCWLRDMPCAGQRCEPEMASPTP